MKNFVQKEVDRKIDAIQDKKEENYNQIVAEYFPSVQPKRSKKLFQILIPAGVAACIVAVGVVYMANSINNGSEIKYAINHEKMADATIAEVNEASQTFQLNFEDVNLINNKRFYDEISGDTLRFQLNLTFGYSTTELIYVTNQFYDMPRDNLLLDETKDFQGIEVHYYYRYSSYQISITAYLEKGGQKMYITYDERSMTDSEDSFWTFLDNFVTVI
jgi:hypothetical protein